MRLKLANPRDAFAAASVNPGEAVELDTVAVAELLRAELTARGNATRTMLVRRVQQIVAPLLALERETVLAACSDLERAGDVNEAPGGVLFATPLRAISLGPMEFRIVGSMPIALLQSKLPGTWTSHGVIRNCRIDQSTDEQWRATVASEGGVIISPETWAGFDTAPKADSGWLASLDARLALPSRPGGVLQRDALPFVEGPAYRRRRRPLDGRRRPVYGAPLACMERVWVLGICMDRGRASLDEHVSAADQ